ncbi:MAG: ribonuclease J [Bacilli bacterium]|nr:ribonuclease J [Bacilli bacterium]
MKLSEKDSTKIFALGGLCEVGKNMYCVMHGDEIVIVDAGVTFPEDDLLGVDYIIPDFSFLKKNENKIKALFITHGHEDHIGGIPFLLQTVNIPAIYAPNQAVGLIKKKLEEKNIQFKRLFVYNQNKKIKFKNITVEFFQTTHSIPDSHGIYIKTPNGSVVMTGDFKFDLTPIGPMANLQKMAEIGGDNPTVLLSDSTNALNDGFSNSESKVDEALGEIFLKHKGRIIIATFASNIYRLKHIVDTCKKNKRKIAIFGRSMETNIEISIAGGYIKHKDIFISAEEANKLPDNKVCLLCTGTQGEPLAALSRIADGSHKQIRLRDNDLVILSSSAIPGNALNISKIINKLYMRGVSVYTNTSLSDIHTSGHGSEEELKLMIRLINPKYFMPYHGEYRMLKKHANIATDCGIPKNNTFVLKNGDVLIMKDEKITLSDLTIPASDIYVDGNRIGEIRNSIIKERQIMANDGIIIVIANLDVNSNHLLNKPIITTRGFVLVNDNEELLNELEFIAEKAINSKLGKNINYVDIKSEIISTLTPFVYEKTGRRPIILPVIMDIKKKVPVK